MCQFNWLSLFKLEHEKRWGVSFNNPVGTELALNSVSTHVIPREVIKMNDRVLLIFEDTKNLKKLKKSLVDNNYLVFVCEIDLAKIRKSIKSVKPDLLVFYYQNTHAEIIKIVKNIQMTTPIPITIFSDESDNQLVSDTITNGATAFIVDGIESHRISYIIEAAKARFQKCQVLKTRLYRAESKENINSDVDKAKALLMKNKDMTAEEAYASLSNLAVRNKLRIEDLSKNLIMASELLYKEPYNLRN